MRNLSTLLVVVLSVGLAFCAGENPVAAALESLDIGQSHLSGVGPFGDGSMVVAGELVGFNARFAIHGKNPGLDARVRFKAEDGSLYDNKALVYGPFSGNSAALEVRFRVSDGLLEFTRKRPGQAILVLITFSSATDSTLRDWEFPQLRFYVR